MLLQGQVASREGKDPLGCGSPLIQESCCCKHAFFWSRPGFTNPHHEVSAYRQGRVAAAQAHEASVLWGTRSSMSPPHLKHPGLLLTQATQTSFRSLNTLSHLRAFVTAVLTPWSAHPTPFPGSCVHILQVQLKCHFLGDALSDLSDQVPCSTLSPS